MIASLSGAIEPPSPVISVVIPWKILDGRCGFTRMVSSDWPSISMKPGATTSPRASTRFVASLPASLPMAAIRPERIPRSAEYHGEPVPSTMRPFSMTTSKGAGDDCA